MVSTLMHLPEVAEQAPIEDYREPAIQSVKDMAVFDTLVGHAVRYSSIVRLPDDTPTLLDTDPGAAIVSSFQAMRNHATNIEQAIRFRNEYATKYSSSEGVSSDTGYTARHSDGNYDGVLDRYLLADELVLAFEAITEKQLRDSAADIVHSQTDKSLYIRRLDRTQPVVFNKLGNPIPTPEQSADDARLLSGFQEHKQLGFVLPVEGKHTGDTRWVKVFDTESGEPIVRLTFPDPRKKPETESWLETTHMKTKKIGHFICTTYRRLFAAES